MFKIENMSTFNDNLENLLKGRGLNKAELSRALMMPESTVRQWKRGIDPGFSVASRIAAFFKVPVSYFEDDEINPYSKKTETLSLFDNEKEVIVLYRKLSKENKEKFLKILEIMV